MKNVRKLQESCGPSIFAGIIKEPIDAAPLSAPDLNMLTLSARRRAGGLSDNAQTFMTLPSASKDAPSSMARFHGKSRIARRLIGDDLQSQKPEKDYSVKELCNRASLFLLRRRNPSDSTKSSDVDRAQHALERAIAKDPHCVEALCNLGLLLYSRKNDPAGAAELYEKALECNSRHTDTLCNYGFLLLCSYTRDVDKASTLLRRCLEEDSTHVDALCNYGLLMHNVHKDAAGAEGMYRRALAQNVKHVQSLYNLANLMREVNRIPEAMDLYKKVIALDPSNLECMCNLGILEQRACRNYKAAGRNSERSASHSTYYLN